MQRSQRIATTMLVVSEELSRFFLAGLLTQQEVFWLYTDALLTALYGSGRWGRSAS